MEGFLGFSESDKISSIRRRPRVTFDFDATPAKWNVLSVSCVVGSPILCAATIPTISPGCTMDFYICLIFLRIE